MRKPVIGISMGDPAGIGPEIVVKAMGRPELRECCRPLVIGDAATLQEALRITGSPLALRPIAAPAEARFAPDSVDVVDLANVDLAHLERGKVSAMAGRAAFEAVTRLIGFAMEGRLDATVTAPINKAALALAGVRHAGHTEIFAERTGSRTSAMMLIEGNLRVIHVSTHCPLRDACDRVQRQRVLEVIRLADAGCRSLGIARPRIAVAGLNPHAGEGGLFGDEEVREIAPAVAEAASGGILVEGPFPPDTVFARANAGGWDAVVAMYHDQGHIPVKLAGFRYDADRGAWQTVSGVNLTLGLPIIRTSVDHGTAFDQAGRGTASDESLRMAIELAARLARSGMAESVNGDRRDPR
jgi:4-hydroxythreonine-4-phosphate dehydrogenase